MRRDEIVTKVIEHLQEMFELDAGSVSLDARLREDLGLDSIDAVDMAAKMEEMTGRRLDEDDLRRIRTVADVVEVVDKMLNAESESLR